MRLRTMAVALGVLCLLGVSSATTVAQTATIVDFPDPAMFFQNTSFAIDGDVAYIPSYDNDTLWSFSLSTGELLDEDGLALLGNASDVHMFANNILALPGWFPDQGIFVADVSDPSNLVELGVIALPTTTNVQGQEIAVDDNGVIGYVADFLDDTLYSFNVETLALEDADGLVLPANPDRIGLAGTRLAMADTSNGDIMVADVSDPTNMTFVGTIDLPGSNSFGSDDNIVFAADGQTGFITTNERKAYAFDVIDMTVLNGDGFSFGTQNYGCNVDLVGTTLACLWGRGLTFLDVSDPTNPTLISNGNFGGVIAPQGGATVALTADGTMAAVPVVYPGNYVYTIDVATGEQVSERFAVDATPNYLDIFAPGDQIALANTGSDGRVTLISELFGVIVGDVDGDGDVDLTDLAALLGSYGAATGDPNFDEAADFNDDGVVNLTDLAALLSNYGYGV